MEVFLEDEPCTMEVILEDSSEGDIEPQVDEHHVVGIGSSFASPSVTRPDQMLASSGNDQDILPSEGDHASVDIHSSDAIHSIRRQDQMHTSPEEPRGAEA